MQIKLLPPLLIQHMWIGKSKINHEPTIAQLASRHNNKICTCQGAGLHLVQFGSPFASHCRAHVMQLKQQLRTIKKGSLSIDESDLVLMTLNGSGPEYALFKMSITVRSDLVGVVELYGVLINQETSQEVASPTRKQILLQRWPSSPN